MKTEKEKALKIAVQIIKATGGNRNAIETFRKLVEEIERIKKG